MKKCHKKSCNANVSEEKKLLIAENGNQYPDIENKGYDNVSLKENSPYILLKD